MDVNIVKFDKYIDNFAKYSQIKTKLIYGSPDKIKNPFISIVIPTYKRPDILKQTLDSVFNQESVSFDYEVIVIDNDAKKSDLKTESLISSYNNFRLLYYRNEENIGPMGNWNRGIELARSKWISFLHDDDLLKSNYLLTIEKIIKRKENGDKEIGYIRPNAQAFYGKNLFELDLLADSSDKIISRIVKTIFNNSLKLKQINKIDVVIDGGSNVFGAPTCGTIINKKAVLEVGGYNEDYLPASDIYVPYNMLKEYRVYRTMEVLGYYRWYENDTLKKETLEGLIREFMLFSKFLSTSSKFIRIFRLEQYNSCLNYIKYRAKEAGVCLSLNDFNYCYKNKPNRIKVIILNCIRRCYQCFKIFQTFFYG